MSPVAIDDVVTYNRSAWDSLVARGDRWTVPVTSAVIAAARRGDWQIVLTPERPVPREWFPPLAGVRTLCLAGAGGQQAPVLAAAGARVTSFDNSPRQLEQDRHVAGRDGLSIETVQGDMRDLGAFADASFDLVVHPCSNCFVPDVRPVWREIARVLTPGGTLLAGFINPAAYLFDHTAAHSGGLLLVRHRLPYADQTSLTAAELQALVAAGEPLVFSHSLEDQIGGQTDAGLTITGLYEDTWPGAPISEYMPPMIGTKAKKPVRSC
jgi:SAM-dependent methyltransferase